MPRLYTRPSVLSGESVDDVIGDGYGVLATVAGESCSFLVASCVLAASVIIWEACAFAALAAVLVAGVTWCVSVGRGWCCRHGVSHDRRARQSQSQRSVRACRNRHQRAAQVPVPAPPRPSTCTPRAAPRRLRGHASSRSLRLAWPSPATTKSSRRRVCGGVLG